MVKGKMNGLTFTECSVKVCRFLLFSPPYWKWSYHNAMQSECAHRLTFTLIGSQVVAVLLRAQWPLLRNFSILWRRKKKDDKKTKAFYDWAITGIPVISSVFLLIIFLVHFEKKFCFLPILHFQFFSWFSIFSSANRGRQLLRFLKLKCC